MAKIVKTDGTVTEVRPKNGIDFVLEELQEIVGGYIEIVNIKDGLMVVNEEGKIKNLPINKLATIIYNRSDIIHGDVLLCDTDQIK